MACRVNGAERNLLPVEHIRSERESEAESVEHVPFRLGSGGLIDAFVIFGDCLCFANGMISGSAGDV